jgi:phospholipid/cholesterol/gamma-HCH transport system substrate-binding protein
MSRQVRVGLLVLAGTTLFLIVLFAIANRSFLFSDTFFIRSRFESVAGLQPGAAVQFQGVNVGRVENVELPDTPGERIVVTMAIQQSAGHLILENTQAQIKSDGLVGNQIIVLIHPAAAIAGNQVEEGDFIPGVDPFDPFEVADKAIATVQRFEQAAATFQEIMLAVQNGEGTLGKFVYDPTLYTSFVEATDEATRVFNRLSDNAEAMVSLAEQATQGVNSILTKIDEGEGTLAKVLNDPAVYNRLLSTSDTLLAISGELRAITGSAENAANWGALGAYRFAELMEAAKHNWLFKRYFEERGYMEKAPFEVRERALEETYKKLEEKERELYEWEQRLQQAATQQTSASATAGPENTSPGSQE